MKKKLPKSLRKYIRKEKARIRREVLDVKKQDELIEEIYPVRKPASKNKNTKDKVSSEKPKLSNGVYKKFSKELPKIQEKSKSKTG